MESTSLKLQLKSLVSLTAWHHPVPVSSGTTLSYRYLLFGALTPVRPLIHTDSITQLFQFELHRFLVSFRCFFCMLPLHNFTWDMWKIDCFMYLIPQLKPIWPILFSGLKFWLLLKRTCNLDDRADGRDDDSEEFPLVAFVCDAQCAALFTDLWTVFTVPVDEGCSRTPAKDAKRDGNLPVNSLKPIHT